MKYDNLAAFKSDVNHYGNFNYMTRGKTIIIQGGQYGSEGKGQIAAFIAHQRGVWAAVRTGSINAGHTVYHKNKKFSMQILPTAWIYDNIMLVLGAGCYIEPEILAKEVAFVEEALGKSIKDRLIIDKNCVWFGTEELKRATSANRHHAMGATGKGASEAIISKMNDRGSENAELRFFMNYPGARELYNFADTVGILNRQLNGGYSVLLEGTQGALLDFNTGPYPYVTSRMTNAPAWLAEAGLAPVNVETILVLRSYPIRVAGNSGPMPMETSWPTLARQINHKLTKFDGGSQNVAEEADIVLFEQALKESVMNGWPEVAEVIPTPALIHFHLWSEENQKRFRVCVSEANAAALRRLPADVVDRLKFFEKTTVTKKLRRVANFDFESARRAILMNAPTSIAYTFLNYDKPQLRNEVNRAVIVKEAIEHLNQRATLLRCPIRYVSTERYQENVVDLGM